MSGTSVDYHLEGMAETEHMRVDEVMVSANFSRQFLCHRCNYSLKQVGDWQHD